MSGAALPIIAMGMKFAGGIMQGVGAKREYDAAARIDEENARLSLLSGEQDVEQILRDERMIAGEAVAQMGGSGAGIGSGTAADIIAESAMQRERAIRARRKQAQGESANHAQAAQDKRAAGRNALLTSAFNTVGGLLSGAADIRAGRIESSARGSVRAAQMRG